MKRIFSVIGTQNAITKYAITKNAIALTIAQFAFVQSSMACPVGQSGPSPAEQNKMRKKAAGTQVKGKPRGVASNGSMPILPTADSAKPWGGSVASQWKPEAILANAVSRALNQGWQKQDIVDVIVTVPVKMKPTADRPYGDGQTNASLEFGPGWSKQEPQLVASLLKFKSGQRVIEFWFSTAVDISKKRISIISTGGPEKAASIDLVLDETGYHGTWKVPEDHRFGDLGGSKVLWIHPMGWDSVFPVDFRFPVFQNTSLVSAVPNAKTSGKTPMDPMEILLKSKESGKLPQDVLKETPFGADWIKNDKGGDYFVVGNIHGEVPGGPLGKTKTAVGGGLTWVIGRGASSTFKNLYTCFDARNFAQESSAGVPSGGGWHEIGDAAETIINAVETAPVAVGFATGLPSPKPPNQLKFAWGLSDVSSVRFLQPGEGMMTGAGDVTWREDEGARPNSDWSKSKRPQDQSGGGRNYHWFFFQSDQPVCTEEWVHNCRPTNENKFGLEQSLGPDCHPAN